MKNTKESLNKVSRGCDIGSTILSFTSLALTATAAIMSAKENKKQKKEEKKKEKKGGKKE